MYMINSSPDEHKTRTPTHQRLRVAFGFLLLDLATCAVHPKRNEPNIRRPDPLADPNKQIHLRVAKNLHHGCIRNPN